MSRSSKKDHGTIWDRLALELYELSSERLNRDSGLIKLFIGIILQAGKDKDMDYFKTDDFLYHCTWIQQSPIFIENCVMKVLQKESIS